MIIRLVKLGAGGIDELQATPPKRIDERQDTKVHHTSCVSRALHDDVRVFHPVPATSPPVRRF